MKPAPFEYHRPASLAETFDLLDRYGDDGRILAGGQSLVPTLNMRLVTPRAVIDINRLPGLDAIRATPEGLEIEEGFITFPTLPGGLLMKVGKMKAQFGKVNTMHSHTLPWVDEPLAMTLAHAARAGDHLMLHYRA